MQPQLPLREQERENWNFFLDIPNPDRTKLNLHKINQQQMQEPLFEFSGACAGCGETPYLKLMSQLFGDRALVANASQKITSLFFLVAMVLFLIQIGAGIVTAHYALESTKAAEGFYRWSLRFFLATCF